MDIAKFSKWKSLDPTSKLAGLLLGQLITEEEHLIIKYVQRVCVTYRTTANSDARQAGRIGCMRAMQKYDPSRGCFSTMAWHWIRSEVQKHLRTHTQDTSRKKGASLTSREEKKSRAVYKLHGRKATPEETGADPFKLFLFQRGVWFERLEDTIKDEDSRMQRTDLLDGAFDPCQQLQLYQTFELVAKYLESMGPRERKSWDRWFTTNNHGGSVHLYYEKWVQEITRILHAEED